METISPIIKRKNIDLPVDALQKLALVAVGKGMSLKKYIESIVIREAGHIKIEVKENPSPSGDPWFDDPKNMEIVLRGLKDHEEGNVIEMSLAEIDQRLGL